MEQKFRVLIIDDEMSNISILRNALESDYIVQISKNSIEALEIANNTHPDLILLDIMMPEMDGYEVLKNLKSNSDTKDIPIIFITSKSEYEDEVKGLKLGAVDYITKPFKPEIVQMRIKTHLNLKLYRDQMEKLVEERTRQLEETNVALRVLLQNRDDSQKKAEEKLLVNVKDIILPVIEKIKLDQLSSSQKKQYLDVIESDLNNFIKPFTVGLHSIKYKVTPTEIHIATLIKKGKTNKEIANVLNITIGTVKWHRENIRAKLGLTNKKVNLRSYLLSLPE